MKSCKKGVDSLRGWCYNHQRCRENSKHKLLNELTTVRSLKTIQRLKSFCTRDDVERESATTHHQNSQIRMSETLRRDDGEPEALASFGKEVKELKIRIEHQSLILAQDERWRRA